MRLLGKRFVPGFKLEGLDYDSGGEDQQPTDDLPVNLRHNGLATANVWPDQPDLPDTNPITGDLGQPAVTADQEDSSTNDDEVEVEEGHSSKGKKKEVFRLQFRYCRPFPQHPQGRQGSPSHRVRTR